MGCEIQKRGKIHNDALKQDKKRSGLNVGLILQTALLFMKWKLYLVVFPEATAICHLFFARLKMSCDYSYPSYLLQWGTVSELK